MKRTKDIILDFTSLLDVVMIILFFFILFSRVDVTKAQTETSQARAEASQAAADAAAAVADADKARHDADALMSRLDQEWRILHEEDSRRAADTAALVDFANGSNLKMSLAPDDAGDWILTLRRGSRDTRNLMLGEATAENLHRTFRALEIAPEDTILCEFLFDADTRGSNAVIKRLRQTFTELREIYPRLFISETDLST